MKLDTDKTADFLDVELPPFTDGRGKKESPAQSPFKIIEAPQENSSKQNTGVQPRDRDRADQQQIMKWQTNARISKRKTRFFDNKEKDFHGVRKEGTIFLNVIPKSHSKKFSVTNQ